MLQNCAASSVWPTTAVDLFHTLHYFLTEPLRILTKKGIPYVFGPAQQTALESLKQGMAEAGTLAYFDKTTTRIIADTNSVGLEAVLLQKIKKDSGHQCTTQSAV